MAGTLGGALAGAPQAGPLAGAAVRTARGATVSPEEMAASRRAEFVDFLREVAKAGPTALLLDDMHWSDESSVGLLMSVIRDVPDVPVALVVAYRDTDLEFSFRGQRHPLANSIRDVADRYARVTYLNVAAFDRSAIAELAEATASKLAGRSLKPREDFSDWLADATGGNPLFVTEYVSLLFERGQVDMDESEVWVSPTKREEIEREQPARVQQLLRARLAQVRDDGLQVIRAGALSGEIFELEQTCQVAQVPLQTALATMTELCERLGILEPVRSQDRFRAASKRYRFYHGLVPEVLRQDLKDHRWDLYQHLCVRWGDYLVEHDATPDPARVAGFFYEGDAPQTTEWAARAAAAATVAGGLAESCEFWTWSAEAAAAQGDKEAELAARMALGYGQHGLRRMTSAVDNLGRAYKVAREASLDPRTQAGTAYQYARALRMVYRWDESARMLTVADSLVPEHEVDLRVHIATLSGGHDLSARGDLPSAEKKLRAALRLPASAAAQATAEGLLALALLGQERASEARDHLRSASSNAIQSEEPGLLYETLLFQLYCDVACLRLEAASRNLDQMKEIASQAAIEDQAVHQFRCRVEALSGEEKRSAIAFSCFWVRCVRLDGEGEMTGGWDNRTWALNHLDLLREEVGSVLGSSSLKRLDEALCVEGERIADAGVPQWAALQRPEQSKRYAAEYAFHMKDLRRFRRRATST